MVSGKGTNKLLVPRRKIYTLRAVRPKDNTFRPEINSRIGRQIPRKPSCNATNRAYRDVCLAVLAFFPKEARNNTDVFEDETYTRPPTTLTPAPVPSLGLA